MSSAAVMDRRALLRGGMAAIVPVLAQRPTQDTGSAAPLRQPELAGRPRDRITDYENDPFIIGVERRLRCTCGCNLDVHTCRTTDFTCTYAPQLHREVVALVEQNKSAEEILAAFVAEYGETILMAPPKEGFNWAAYLLPGIVIGIVGSVIAWVLIRRSRMAARAPAASNKESPGALSFTELSEDDATRLQAELQRLEQ